jgi:branched-chain amino acid transport system ATP-binding protein
MLSIRDVSVSYGNTTVLKNIDMHVDTGETVAMFGPNGSGKTSLLRCVCGLIKAASGELLFKGTRLDNMSVPEIIRLGISLVPEGRRVFYSMTVLENLLVGGYIHNKNTNKKNLERVFNIFPRLRERITQKGGTLSGGEQSMLVIGRALMSQPRFLILDEPCLGLAPIIVKKVEDTIKDVVQEGLTVLLVEQNAKFAMACSLRGYVITNGVIVAEGQTDDLMSREEDIRRAYLGR